MKHISYNAKELLATLLEVEAMLVEVNSKNYPNREFLLTEDTDKILEEFLEYQSVEDSNAGYISTELALFYLRKELVKTIDIVVISNDLRAYNDYNREHITHIAKPNKKSNNWNNILFGFLLGFIAGSLILYLVFL